MEPFLGQIILFAGNFAPRNFALCDGQLLSVAANSALFSILGTQYGGDGITTFALPDLRSRVPIHQGTGIGLTNRFIGEQGGSETVTLTTANLPTHSHAIQSAAEGNTDDPDGNYIAGAGINSFSTIQNTSSKPTGNTGGGSPVNNLPPFLTLNYCIALTGIYPSRS